MQQDSPRGAVPSRAGAGDSSSAGDSDSPDGKRSVGDADTLGGSDSAGGSGNQDSPGNPGSESVAEFADRCGVSLLRFAYLLCGDRYTAEDLLQDVFAAMYRRFPAAMPLDNPVGYARRALANTNISRARRASASEVVSDALPEMATDAVEGGVGLAERDLLWQAMLRLPVRQRTVLVLRYYADATNADVAQMMGTRRGTVRSLASRGLATLRADPFLRSSDNEGGQP